MRSLRGRILITASLVLAGFLGGAGVLLDRAFRESALDGVEDRLRGSVFLLLGAANFDTPSVSDLIDSLPDPALSTPGSGRYARIVAPDAQVAWSSRSMLGLELEDVPLATTGAWRLLQVSSKAGERLFVLTYGILWEGSGDSVPRHFIIEAYESEELYRATVSQFRRSLWSWFAALSVTLLFVQAYNLNRGLRPLASVGDEVRAIEEGTQEAIAGSYPVELATLTRNLNKLLRQNRDSLQRYRNALGDLAHSIKTPLAVLRSELERGPADAVPCDSMLEQVERIDRTVQYHLQRAATAGNAQLAPARPVAPVIARVLDSLRKVYFERNLVIETALEPGALFPGDEGDLMEIVGNLADNACKWARHRVLVEALGERGPNGGGRLELRVRDDGPGIPSDQIERLMQRGIRLDESVEGHGIGLAIVRDMVEGAYRGQLSLTSSTRGTTATVKLTWS
jgi:two-component system, OmpR family, sensor histidine kinase PhoQ